MKDSIVKYLINDLAACQDKKNVLDTLSLGGINVCIGFPTNERCPRGQAGDLLPARLEHARAGALR